MGLVVGGLVLGLWSGGQSGGGGDSRSGLYIMVTYELTGYSTFSVNLMKY